MSNNVLNMPDQNKVFDEASDWIVQFDKGLSPDQEIEFQHWVHEDPEHYRQFMSMAQLWDGMDELSRLADLFPEPAIEAEKKGKPSSFSVMAIAASFAVVAVTALIFTSYSSLFSNDNVETFYETSIGEHSTVNLMDGSVLVLNTNSLVRVNFDNSNRLVTLERGEMHIDVAHDKARPLTVKAASKVVQAVGTAFNIELLTNKKLELIVVDGEVRVGDRNQFENDLRGGQESKESSRSRSLSPVRLSEASLSVIKGEKALLGLSQPVKQKLNDKDIERNLLWRSGSLVFKGETLESVIDEIGRYTSVEFTIMSPEIKNVRLAGLFKTGDVNGLLLALDESFDITSKRVSEDRVNLYARERNL